MDSLAPDRSIGQHRHARGALRTAEAPGDSLRAGQLARWRYAETFDYVKRIRANRDTLAPR
jgi:hypothetical protein